MAVTTEDKVICTFVLPNHTSVFSAEIIAIHEAIKNCNSSGEYAIFTDSLSALRAISNLHNNNYYASSIRNSLIKFFPKFIIIWIPGHVSIKGNEFADCTAKQAQNSPIFGKSNKNFNDVRKHIKRQIVDNNYSLWNLTNLWYKTINPNQNNIYDWIPSSNEFSRRDLTKIIRLRLGHTKITHDYIMNKTDPPICSCNNKSPLNITHIFTDCPLFENDRIKFFGNFNPLSLLSSPNKLSIKQIILFLKNTKLYDKL